MKQEELEQNIKAVLADISALSGSVPGQLFPEIQTVDLDQKTIFYVFTPEKSHTNQWGAIHGGIICTLFDNVMGICAKAFSGVFRTPTIDMRTSYLRPMLPERPVYFKVQLLSQSRHLCNVNASAWQDDPSTPCSTATAVYFLKND